MAANKVVNPPPTPPLLLAGREMTTAVEMTLFMDLPSAIAVAT